MSVLDDYPFAGLSSDYIEGLREGVRLAEAEAKQRIYILELALNWAESSRDSFEKSTEKAEAERDAAVAGLRDVCEPLGYLRRKAEADGSVLNGYAHTLINQASFLQDIARAALLPTPFAGSGSESRG